MKKLGYIVDFARIGQLTAETTMNDVVKSVVDSVNSPKATHSSPQSPQSPSRRALQVFDRRLYPILINSLARMRTTSPGGSLLLISWEPLDLVASWMRVRWQSNTLRWRRAYFIRSEAQSTAVKRNQLRRACWMTSNSSRRSFGLSWRSTITPR